MTKSQVTVFEINIAHQCQHVLYVEDSLLFLELKEEENTEISIESDKMKYFGNILYVKITFSCCIL